MRRFAVLGVLAALVLSSGGTGWTGPQDRYPPERTVFGSPFTSSRACALCHDASPRSLAMHDEEGRDVSPHGLWRSSMMANASRDPVWQAMVAVEAAETPSRAEEIEATCLRCHAPMAGRETRMAHLEGADDRGHLGRDGASCTVCHGIQALGLGRASSFSGGWQVNDEMRLFGPHAAPFARPMERHTGYVATFATHVKKPALCATCHTLFTDAVDAEGEATGHRLPEQTPYLEWRNSAFSTESDPQGPEAATCQDCHLPTTDRDGEPLRTHIAHNPGGRTFPPTTPRSPYGRHVLAGANKLVPGLLRDRPEALGALAPSEAFDATLTEVGEQVGRAVTLQVESVERREEAIHLDLRLENRAGHKVPTAHPTRRVWLEVVLKDASGAPVFASGRFDEQGRILGAEGRPLPSEATGGPTEPHRDVIRSGDEVALYQSVMEDADGRPTWLLLRGTRYVKDDRLLPRGWRSDGPHADVTSPSGVEGDEDFGAGGDVVHYVLPFDAPADAGFAIEIRLWHQSVGARWMAELLAHDLPQVEALRALLADADRTPTEIARARVETVP